MSSEFLRELRRHFSSNALYTDPADCWAYGYDNSRRHRLPDYVVFPSRHEEVQAAVRLCFEHRAPLTARGRGTATTGATVPLCGGLVLSTERMNRILEISAADRYAIVETGATNQAVQDAVREHGFFWPPDPTSAAYCSIGGNLAVNAAGPRAVKYGTTRENTLGLRAVTGAGTEIRVGVRTTKGVVGYDLTRLLIGSEGTLAIITEATLKLSPLPAAKATLRAIYRDVASATDAIARIMRQPEVPCALEFMDRSAIAAVRGHGAADIPEQSGAVLLIEVDGYPEDLAGAARRVADAARIDGLLDLRDADDDAERERLWSLRRNLAPAMRRIAPEKINEDVVVPVSRLPRLVMGLDRLAMAHRLPIVNFGHAGNGNLHVNILFDPADGDASIRARSCLADLFDLVLELGGTLSGEHGVGIDKRPFIDREIGESALDLMRAIKKQFDPAGILNPDKVLPHSA